MQDRHATANRIGDPLVLVQHYVCSLLVWKHFRGVSRRHRLLAFFRRDSPENRSAIHDRGHRALDRVRLRVHGVTRVRSAARYQLFFPYGMKIKD